MEVFFQNLKPGCSERRLKDYLAGVFSQFDIKPNEFLCEKRKSTTTATATILDPRKARLFIERYGNRKGVLNLDGPFICKISNKGADQYKLRSLLTNKVSKKKAAPSKKDPDPKSFQADSIVCGVWDHQNGNLQFVEKYHSNYPTKVLFGKKDMILIQSLQDYGQKTQWIIINYSSIQSIATCGEQKDLLFLTLDRAPRFYDIPSTSGKASERSMDHMFGRLSVGSRQPPPLPKVRMPAMDICHTRFVQSCLVYKIRLIPNHLPAIQRLLMKDKRLPDIIKWQFSVRSAPESSYTAMLSLQRTLTDANLSFAIKFQLQKLAQNSFLLPELVSRLVPVMIGIQEKHGMERSVQRLQLLAKNLPFAGPDADDTVFEFDYLKDYLKDVLNDEENDELSAFELARRHPNLILIHRARVTPAGIYLEGPYAEAKNRVLEEYSDYALEHFLRVSFEDENGEALKYEPLADLGKIHNERFKGVLNNAIQIAGRKFGFLGFSHSSLRESSCWFLAEFDHQHSRISSRKLISALGDFSHIRSPAKCGARIGQAFTDLIDNIHIPQSAIVLIPDVKRNGRCFSDGCSTASLEVFEKLWNHMPPNTFKPTTFQIRYGGVKGLVSLDRSLKGLVMNIRPSQKKFESDTDMLGICGAAKRTLPFFLNRPLIKILEDLGIEASTFMDFQVKAVEQLRLMASSAANAATFAEVHDIGKAVNLPWFLRELHYLGIDALKDQFLWSAVELIIIMRLREIKYKSRIPIHPDGAATLFGIMDETNTLKEGEIYCTVNEGKVFTGRVAITRSPAMHPGDIQPAMAVDVPKDHPLKQLHNVVVFSQQGPRDLPSMLSGGDLDGDLFNVLVDGKLRPKLCWSPADYTIRDPIDLGRTIKSQDISNFFIDFMSSDQLGQIAVRHLQFADQGPRGTLETECIALAELHSTAVDFSKTGIPVNIKELPQTNSKCKPDFMANGPRMLLQKGVPTFEINPDTGFYHEEEDDILEDLEDPYRMIYYESDKALGQLYRQIDESKFLSDLQSGRRSGSYESHHALPKLWAHIQQKTQGFLWDHLKIWARNIKDQYNNQVVDMMYQYALDPHRPLTELEVFLGIVMGKDGGMPSKRAREAASSIREHFNDLIKYTIECILKGEEGEFDEEALERSLACFSVSLEYDEVVDRKIGKLQSFGYLAGIVCLRQVKRAAVDGF